MIQFRHLDFKKNIIVEDPNGNAIGASNVEIELMKMLLPAGVYRKTVLKVLDHEPVTIRKLLDRLVPAVFTALVMYTATSLGLFLHAAIRLAAGFGTADTHVVATGSGVLSLIGLIAFYFVMKAVPFLVSVRASLEAHCVSFPAQDTAAFFANARRAAVADGSIEPDDGDESVAAPATTEPTEPLAEIPTRALASRLEALKIAGPDTAAAEAPYLTRYVWLVAHDLVNAETEDGETTVSINDNGVRALAAWKHKHEGIGTG